MPVNTNSFWHLHCDLPPEFVVVRIHVDAVWYLRKRQHKDATIVVYHRSVFWENILRHRLETWGKVGTAEVQHLCVCVAVDGGLANGNTLMAKLDVLEYRGGFVLYACVEYSIQWARLGAVPELKIESVRAAGSAGYGIWVEGALPQIQRHKIVQHQVHTWF